MKKIFTFNLFNSRFVNLANPDSDWTSRSSHEPNQALEVKASVPENPETKTSLQKAKAEVDKSWKEKKERAKNVLITAKATEEQLFTFEQAYQKSGPKMKEIITANKLKLKDPEDWTTIHNLLMEEEGQYFSKDYADAYEKKFGVQAPLPKTTPSENLDFLQSDISELEDLNDEKTLTDFIYISEKDLNNAQGFLESLSAPDEALERAEMDLSDAIKERDEAQISSEEMENAIREATEKVEEIKVENEKIQKETVDEIGALETKLAMAKEKLNTLHQQNLDDERTNQEAEEKTIAEKDQAEAKAITTAEAEAKMDEAEQVAKVEADQAEDKEAGEEEEPIMIARNEKASE